MSLYKFISIYISRLSYSNRKIFKVILDLLSPRDLFLKKTLAKSYIQGTERFQLSNGMHVFNESELSTLGISEIRDEAISLLKSIQETEAKDRESGAAFKCYDVIEELPENSKILNLLENKWLYSSLVNYFKELPVLAHVFIWDSKNDLDVKNSSQYYHLDGQDTNTLQLFVHLSDVDSASGPLTLLTEDDSLKVIKETNYRKVPGKKRIEDEEVVKVLGSDKKIEMVGKSGTAYIVDTDTCLHYGSRKSERSRQVLVLQFYTSTAFVLPYFWKKQRKLKYLSKPALKSNPSKLIFGV